MGRTWDEEVWLVVSRPLLQAVCTCEREAQTEKGRQIHNHIYTYVDELTASELVTLGGVS